MDKNTLITQFRNRIRIDTRSLAVFRIIAGILIVADIFLRLRSFRFFYTDEGVLPVDVAQGIVPDQAISVFFLSSDPTITLLLFGIHLLVAIQLILGYYTRVAVVVSFLFVISLDYRNPLVTSYADLAFRHLLFWGMFMPLGARYSIDSIRNDGAPQKQYTGLAGMFAILQMVGMYITNGSHKIPWREYWLDGGSMTGILHYDSVAFLLSEYIREIPVFLQFSGIMWYSLMLGSPLLLLFAGRERYLLATVYAGGHLFLAITVRIGAFPFAAVMGLLVFFQSQAWTDARRVASWLGVPVDRIVQEVTQYGSRLERRLPRVGLSERVPPIERLETPVHLLVIALVLISGIFMVVPNLQTAGVIDDDETLPYQDEVEWAQHTVRMAEPPWRFYQGPVTYNEYYVFAGETTDGELVDVFNDRPLQWDRPHGSANYEQLETYRHRFYMYAIMDRGEENREDGVIEHYNQYLCDNYEWEGNSLERLNMYYIDEDATLETVGEYRQYDRTAVLLDSHSCGDTDSGPVSEPPPEYLEGADSDLREFLESGDDE
ncbi:HTTM domain-containing protein [Natrialbaceae archaeon A-gly3]